MGQRSKTKKPAASRLLGTRQHLQHQVLESPTLGWPFADGQHELAEMGAFIHVTNFGNPGVIVIRLPVPLPTYKQNLS